MRYPLITIWISILVLHQLPPLHAFYTSDVKSKPYSSPFLLSKITTTANDESRDPSLTPSLKTNDSDDQVDDDREKFKGTQNPLRLAVLKLGMTELRWTSPLNYEKRNGDYICASCGSILFNSEGKYDSGSGWPSFWKTSSNSETSAAVSLKREWDGRMECVCGTCDGHLGHVFMDGPRRSDVDREELESVPESDPKGGLSEMARLPRFCVNGASLRFVPKSD